MQRCQPLEITNLEVFFWTSTLTYPTEFADATPSRKISFLIWTPYPPPPTPPSSLSVTSIGFILIQSNSCLNRNNKETTLFFLFTKTCITQENEARNHYTSIRSQMILEFWNIWSLNLSFLWATDQNFLLSRSFGHPHRRAGDWLCIRETSG